MNQGIVEKHEPVDRKTACVLKSQSLITGLTDQPPRRFTKRVLKEEENSWLPAQLHPHSSSPPQVHWNKTICPAGRAPGCLERIKLTGIWQVKWPDSSRVTHGHLSREALPEVERVLGFLPPLLQMKSHGFIFWAGILQLLIIHRTLSHRYSSEIVSNDGVLSKKLYTIQPGLVL